MPRLWVIGGTQESRQLVQALSPVPVPMNVISETGSLLVSVTTMAARQLYPTLPEANIWVGCLTPESGDTFIQKHEISAILDASHPFATTISQLAIALAQQYQLPYLRYERPIIEAPHVADWSDRAGRPGNLHLSQLAEVFTGQYLAQERTLLTLGYRFLEHFAPWQSVGILFARILPSEPALTAALAAGFTSDRIIALRPPITADLEKALWQQWGITQVVTKASGHAGGETQKQAIAAALGVRLLRIARPSITYPHQTHSLEIALQFGHQHCRP
ncbi:MAG: cobalt-precorrin-6A reductase [Cyanobacteria bacterium P01_H01_bin.58]